MELKLQARITTSKAKPVELLAWDDYLATGIDIIDEQHRGLIDLVNETASALVDDAELSGGDTRRLMDYLVEYAKVHFSTEEALMALSGVDERHIERHRQSHDNFMQQLVDMSGELRAGSTLSGQQLMEFLANWLVFHILGDDQSMGKQLQAIATGVSAERAFDEAGIKIQDPAQAAATRCLSKLYTFMAQRNQNLQSAKTEHRQQLAALVAERTDELGASEDRFLVLFKKGTLPVLMVALGEDFLPKRVADANPAACALLGYTHEEMLGLAPQDLVAPAEIARFPLLINELLTTGHFECEMTHVTREGKPLATKASMIRLVLRGQLVAMILLEAIGERAPGEPAGAGEEAQKLAHVRETFLSQMRQDIPVPHNSVLRLVYPDSDADTAKTLAFLAQQPLFQELPAEQLARLAACSREKRLNKDEILFQKGDKPRSLFLVMSGQIKLAISSAQGNEKVMGIIGPQQLIGEAEMFTDRPYPVFAQALADAVLLTLGQADLFDLVGKNAAFAQKLLQRLGLRLHDLVQDVESYTLRSAVERVIGYLLQHARMQAPGNLDVKLPAKKMEIASLLYLTPETLSRIFRDLSDAGLITVKGLHVRILDADRLSNYQSA